MIAFEVAEYEPPQDDFLNWLEERDRAITGCASRPSGHAWQVVGEPGEGPELSCADCPAGSDDLVGDSCIYMEEEPYEIGGQVVDFTSPLPADAEPYSIPVAARVEPDMTSDGPHGPAEVRTLLILLTAREVTQ